jgi:hypothetical protein
MQLNNLILPVVALSAAAILLTPGTSDGYSLIGGSLSQTQRDFRTYNNFADSATNNNQTADANFPGHQGAVMAIWKGSIEWGSELHGNGDGDPHQAFGLGSGGANFDPSMQGEATGTGSSNDNTHSPLSGGSGGVLAYTETPISNGWRIRYYESWTWADGPGSSIPGSQIDLQGVACHEYGHALGLGHSTVNGAVMYPSISGTGVVTRSIENDDIAGIKAIYGTAAGSKPHIGGFTVTGNTLTVTGSGFDSSGNQVWFTQANAGGNGTPIKVTGLSSNGTTITASIPGSAGPGDIQVRRNSTAHSGLSNAFPYDGNGGGGPTCGVTLIGVGTGGANIGSLNTADSPTLGTTVNLVASDFNNSSVGTLILSFGTSTTPLLGGTIFIDYLNPVGKIAVALSSGLGVYPLALPATPSLAYVSGYAQFGAADGTQPAGWAFSNAIELTFCP